jgi:hypothetical protein
MISKLTKVAAVLLATVAACGTSSNPDDGGADASGSDVTEPADAKSDTAPDAPSDAPTDGADGAPADAAPYGPVCSILSCSIDADCGQGCGPCVQNVCVGYNAGDP